jgi:hypothetical protein
MIDFQLAFVAAVLPSIDLGKKSKPQPKSRKRVNSET